jgi:hypothetical protein
MLKIKSREVTTGVKKVVTLIRATRVVVFGFWEALKYDYKISNQIMPKARAEYPSITKQDFGEKLLCFALDFGQDMLLNENVLFYYMVEKKEAYRKEYETYLATKKEYIEYWLKEPMPPDLVSSISIYCARHAKVFIEKEKFYDPRFNSISGLVEKMALCHNCFPEEKIRATLVAQGVF